MQSYSYEIRPIDPRCRYWAKIIRAGRTLPMPDDVHGAGNIPGPYLQYGEEELLPGDVLFEGEANHHRKDRGWTYKVLAVTSDGELISLRSGFGEQKKLMKQQGMAAELLKGSGDVAAMVRIAHGVRLGMHVEEEMDDED